MSKKPQQLAQVGPAALRGTAYRAGWVLAFWYEHADGPSVRTLMTVEAEGAAIRHLKNYFFSPDLLAEVCAELGVPYRVNGYRYWP